MVSQKTSQIISEAECKHCCEAQIRRLGVLLNTDTAQVLEAFEKEFSKGEIKSAPEYAEFIFNAFNEKTGVDDPYKAIKAESNREAVRLMPTVEQLVGQKYSGLQKLIETSIVGNMIDYGAFHEVKIEEFVKTSIAAPYFRFDIKPFEKDLAHAKTILYIADNAGEIFFDVPLLRYMKSMGKEIHFAVRGAPIINDVTLEDAECANIKDLAHVLSTGAKIPGIVMGKCSDKFKKIFYSVDLVISKGQGNFETLYSYGEKPKKLYFLFVVKCKPVAQHIGAKLHDKVLMKA
jgi:uncharacterized protein with ATP-grasp and redox domains